MPTQKSGSDRATKAPALVAPIDRPSLVHGGGDAERDRQSDDEQHRHRREQQGRRHAPQHELRDRDALDDRVPEIEPDRLPDVDRQLLPDRPVEAVRGARLARSAPASHARR